MVEQGMAGSSGGSGSDGGGSLSNILNAPSDQSKGASAGAQGAGAASTASVSRSDPSLLHQLSALQTEKQDLLTARRELEAKLKEMEEEKQKAITAMEQEKETHKKEKQEFTEVYRREMQQMKDEFMNEWMETLSKLSPEVIAKMKTGVDHMIDNGMKQDRMWEILCTASKAHKMNVDTIEELRKTNTMLSDKNKDLEEQLRDGAGFSVLEARLGTAESAIGRKRMRTEDPAGDAVPRGARADDMQRRAAPPQAAPAPSDVWGQFEQFMIQSHSVSH